MDEKQMEAIMLDVVCKLGKKHGIEPTSKAVPFALEMAKPLLALQGTENEPLAPVALDIFRHVMDAAESSGIA